MPRPRSERRSAWPAVVLAVLVILAILYVASIGPASRMERMSLIDQSTFLAIYRPVFWVTDDTWAGWRVTDYTEFCGGRGAFTMDLDVPFSAEPYRRRPPLRHSAD